MKLCNRATSDELMSWFLQPRGKRARGGKDGRTWPEKKALSDIATNHRVWSKQESGVAQLCPTLCDPVDCGLPGSSIHGIFQAIVLEWIAISFSRGSSRPRNRTRVSHIAGRRFICSVYHAKFKAEWITSWNQDCLEKTSTTSDRQMLSLWWQKGKRKERVFWWGRERRVKKLVWSSTFKN